MIGASHRIGVAALATLAGAPCVAQERIELPADDRRLDVEVADVYAVGRLEGEGWDVFGEVTRVAFDGRGRLYIMDAQSDRLAVVDRDGNLAWSVGRAGDGPEEWRGAGSMVVARDGRAFVADGGHRVYHVYGPDGRYLDPIPMDTDGGVTVSNDMAMDPGGDGFFSAASPALAAMEMLRRDGAPASTRTVKRTRLGERAVREAFFEARQPAPLARTRTDAGGAQLNVYTAPMFEPGLHFAPLPGGSLAVVDSTAYEIRIVGPDGREVRRLERPSLQTLRVTERMREAEAERRIRAMLEGGPAVVSLEGGGATLSEEQVRERVTEHLRDATAYPRLQVVRRLRAGWDGVLWVERATADVGAPGPIDLIDPDGGYIGTIPPQATGVPDAFGPDGLAAYIEAGELGTPRVVVRRLPPAVR